ncbi:hypothetical protein [Streptomyces sp. NBC_00258]|uniref:hypothetical protein n=1 Tax=Streptomyces sp. NBC_00258 TaxID=2903642 RepID=UPI002E281A7F|nr:hypothetical protein [Streptomyces sp. NBC_00258]
MSVIGTRVVGLGKPHISTRTEAGTVEDVEAELTGDADEVPHVKVAWDSGDTTWISADGVTPEK